MSSTEDKTHAAAALDKANRSLTRQLWVFAAGSFIFGFALVPLYSVLCDVTGYGDQQQLVRASAVVTGEPTNRLVTVELVSLASTLGDWDFRPEAGTVQVHPGQLYEAKFYAKNLRGQAIVAQAVPSLAPTHATQYFHKTECFCFTPQPFAANQARELTVKFSVDPKLPSNIDRLTLAYALYDSPSQVVQSAALKPVN